MDSRFNHLNSFNSLLYSSRRQRVALIMNGLQGEILQTDLPGCLRSVVREMFKLHPTKVPVNLIFPIAVL